MKFNTYKFTEPCFRFIKIDIKIVSRNKLILVRL